MQQGFGLVWLHEKYYFQDARVKNWQVGKYRLSDRFIITIAAGERSPLPLVAFSVTFHSVPFGELH